MPRICQRWSITVSRAMPAVLGAPRDASERRRELRRAAVPREIRDVQSKFHVHALLLEVRHGMSGAGSPSKTAAPSGTVDAVGSAPGPAWLSRT